MEAYIAAEGMKVANTLSNPSAIKIGRAPSGLILAHVQRRQAVVKKANTPPARIRSGLKHGRPAHFEGSSVSPLGDPIVLRGIRGGILGNRALLGQKILELR